MTFSTDFTREEFKARRQGVCEAIGEATAIVVGAPASDRMEGFRQYNDFHYLCGVAVPHAYLAIDGRSGRTTLFLPGSQLLTWESDERLLCADDPDYAADVSGVDEVRGWEALGEGLDRAEVLYTHFSDGEGARGCQRSITDARRVIEADPWDGRPTRGDHFIGRARARHPGIEVRDLTPILLEMRMRKSPREVELLRRAAQLAAGGLVEAMRATRPGVMEYELAAVLQYHYYAGGASDLGYMPIVGGGRNAFYGHYHSNSSPLESGDLVLVDCAPDYRYYTSDITRMWPVNGTYTPAQRALYGFVTEYHKTLLAAIRPGRTCDEIEEEAVEIMRGRLPEFDFASPAHATGPQWMFDFRQHLAHSVGLSVHDGVSHKDEPLRPGIVFAVDPQMKIEAERLYLRVEDTGVVTEDGFDVLTKDVPLELDELEAIMKEPGLLQAFPPRG